MLRRLLPICSIILLTACGFHLRGSQDSATLPFKTLSIIGNTKSLIVQNLSDSIQGQAIIVAPPSPAQVIVELSDASRRKIVLSKDVHGRAIEYRLYTSVTIQAYAANKDQLISPFTLMVTRTMSTGNGYDTGIDVEEARLYADMDADLANQVQYRLRAIKLKP